MELRARWFFVEATKFALILGFFFWIQARIADTKHEVYASTSRLVDRQSEVTDRLIEFEEDRQVAGAELEATNEVVATFEDVLADHRGKLEERQVNVERLIHDQSAVLRAEIQQGLDRMEGTSHSAFQQSQIIGERVAHIEQRIDRSSHRMKTQMLYPVAQLRGNGTVGSGVVVASMPDEEDGGFDTYVVTAYHVVQEIVSGADEPNWVEDLRFLEPLTDSLEPVARRAEVLAENEPADLALLRVDMEERWRYVAELATPTEMSRASIFDPVYAVGCPLGNKPLPTVGEISCQKKLVGGQNFWMINAPTFFGNSGGGVFLTSSGRLAGISSMIYTYGKTRPMVVPHMGLFVPLPTVRSWLTDEGYGFTLRDPETYETRPASASHEAPADR